MDVLVSMYRTASVDPAGTALIRFDGVATSPAIALLRAHFYDKPNMFLYIEPAPVYATTTYLHFTRFRDAVSVYVYYEARVHPQDDEHNSSTMEV
jgi:hypothetical protein